jgi:hypothetical protein
MSWWWYPLIAFAIFAVAAIARLFATRNSATVEMPGGETIFPPYERR